MVQTLATVGPGNTAETQLNIFVLRVTYVVQEQLETTSVQQNKTGQNSY